MELTTPLRSMARRILPFAHLFRDRRRLDAELRKWKRWQGFPSGHFHSPIPNLDDVRRDAAKVFDRTRKSVPGIDLRWQQQEDLFRQLSGYYPDLPFAPSAVPGLRYYFDNGFFSYSDAILLFCLLRHLRPRHVIEVGSGFSSCVILDTVERFLEGDVQCVFIDPNPARLYSRMSAPDRTRVTVRAQRVQEIEPSFFERLGNNDVLVIDSSHVGKTDSDVTFLLFEVLPRLNPGVYVHFHDIFYPFEYPSEWVLAGWAWNEAYFLRAFLQFNRSFEIAMWGSALAEQRPKLVSELMPLCMRNTGASLWIRRTGAESPGRDDTGIGG